MTFNPFNSAAPATDRAAFDEGLRSHMMRVYNYMGIGVALTGLVAWLVASTPQLTELFFTPTHQPTALGFISIFAPLAFMFFFSFAAMRSSLGLLQAMFWLFCGVMGLSMSALFLIFTGESMARTFFVVAAMFLATSIYGYTTRTDLTRMGGFMVMGLIGIIIAGIVNIFLHSSGLQFAVSVLGVIIFTGLTAWDTQRIKETYAEGYGVETNGKLAIFGALSLYLNFINLFQLMLQFMGTRRD
ncbi:MAG TPA: Bax inhibitor-1/YccA family protein [Alphaproteobacteria bacterium]|nr:Bax inhibitor-1/YccA family protein [Alphaproteobacteria bacterium]